MRAEEAEPTAEEPFEEEEERVAQKLQNEDDKSKATQAEKLGDWDGRIGKCRETLEAQLDADARMLNRPRGEALGDVGATASSLWCSGTYLPYPRL